MPRLRTRIRLAVPAYFHPSCFAEDWQLLLEAAPYLRLVILNVASGPGFQPDRAFVAMRQRLHTAGITVVGYVDTDYGRCSREQVQRDIVRHRAWYRVDGIFFDRVPSGSEHLPQYRSLASTARGLDAQLVVFNHGVYPDSGYARLADLLVTFEGPIRSHEQLKVPPWAYRIAAERFCHLVYGTPRAEIERVAHRALRHNTGVLYVTNLDGVNPWRRLATTFASHLVPLVSSIRRVDAVPPCEP